MPLMNSFYGGRRGASFVIVKNYVDVLSMTKDFSLGNDFTEVKFDEYVLINNPRKNHPDNGKIFRRGYDYNSDRTLSSVTLLYKKQINENEEESWVRCEVSELTEEKYKELSSQNNKFETESIQAYGAEYIGCIVGPAGKAPLLSIGSYEEAYNKNADPGLETRKGQGSYSPNGNNPGLIPGKDGNEYHDSIEWAYASIRNDQFGDDTQAFIGFKFPYLVTQMQTQMVEPYAPENSYKGKNVNQGDYTDTSEIHKKILTTENGVTKEIFDYQLGENQEEILHPYYNKWHLNIPKGVKGDTLKNFKITTFNNYQGTPNNPSDKTAIYELYKDEESGEWRERPLIGGGIEPNYQFFKDHYGFTDENLQENQEYNLQKLLNLLENKQILVYEIINYDNKQEGQKKYYFLGDYNQIEDIVLEDDGEITISFTNQDDKILGQKLKWIKDIKLFAGHWEEEYQDMTDEEGHLVYLDENDELVYFPYPENTVYKELDENDNPVPAQRLIGRYWRNVTDTSEVTAEDNSVLNQIQNGSLVIHYNQEEEDEVYNIPWVDKVKFKKETGELFYGLTNQNDANILIGDHLYSIDKVIQTDNQLKIVYNHTVDGTEEGEKYTQSFPLKSVSKIVLLKNPSEEENAETEEVNNVFPIFVREIPAQGEVRGKIKYTENYEPIYESFVPNDEGLYQTTDPDDENTKKEVLTGIVVFYTDGDHELITGQRIYDAVIIQDNNQTRGTITEEIGGGFDYLEEFGFETAENSIHGVENVPNVIYYKTLSDKNTTEVPLTYPVAMYYDQNTGLIKYANSQNQEVDVGNLPIVESIDIGDDLDVYVKMSHPANYFQNIDPSHTNHDQKHRYSENNYWYKIGNLIQRGLTFAGVRRVFLYSELKEQILALLDSQNVIYSLWDNWQEGSKISADDMVTTLNLLYPSGNQQIGDNEENSEDITSEEGQEQGSEINNEDESSSSNSSQNNNSAFLFIAVKQNSSATSDFYAYSYDITREVEGTTYGTWFYVGSIGDLGSPDSIFRISEMNSNSTEQNPDNPDGTVSNPAILFRTPRDIYEINFTDVILSNPMKEIKEGASYKTSIKTTTRLPVGQIIQVKMNDNLIQTFTSGSGLPYEVNIPEVTGPIEIIRRTT